VGLIDWGRNAMEHAQLGKKINRTGCEGCECIGVGGEKIQRGMLFASPRTVWGILGIIFFMRQLNPWACIRKDL